METGAEQTSATKTMVTAAVPRATVIVILSLLTAFRRRDCVYIITRPSDLIDFVQIHAMVVKWSSSAGVVAVVVGLFT